MQTNISNLKFTLNIKKNIYIIPLKKLHDFNSHFTHSFFTNANSMFVAICVYYFLEIFVYLPPIF